MNKTTLSPRKANTYNKLLKLRNDNKGFGNSLISINEDHVSVWGEDKGGWISIKKRDFNRMIEWYNKEQVIRKIK